MFNYLSWRLDLKPICSPLEFAIRFLKLKCNVRLISLFLTFLLVSTNKQLTKQSLIFLFRLSKIKSSILPLDVIRKASVGDNFHKLSTNTSIAHPVGQRIIRGSHNIYWTIMATKLKLRREFPTHKAFNLRWLKPRTWS